MNKIYNTIIVDDESLAIDRLSKLLGEYSENIKIIGTATDGKEGSILTERLKPDLIFLDIQMPVMDGFEMLEKISYSPKIIFTTAYEQYAIKAFESCSIDYLLKPIEKERLARSISKLDTMFEQESHLKRLIEVINKEELETITVKIGDRYLIVRTEDITYFQAKDKYVSAVEKNGKSHILNTTVTELEQRLGKDFIRINRSSIINIRYVSEIHKTFNNRFSFEISGVVPCSLTSSSSYSQEIRKVLKIGQG